jgi:hypothetical protein
MIQGHSVPHLTGTPRNKMPVRIPGCLPPLAGLIEVWGSVAASHGARCSLGWVGHFGCFFPKLDPKTCVCAHLHSDSESITWYIYFCPLADFILCEDIHENINVVPGSCQLGCSYFRVKSELGSNKSLFESEMGNGELWRKQREHRAWHLKTRTWDWALIAWTISPLISQILILHFIVCQMVVTVVMWRLSERCI